MTILTRHFATWILALGGTAFAENSASSANASSNKETRDQQHSAFDDNIREIFQARCIECHGPEEQESGLRLDQRDSLLQGGFSGEPAVVPGDLNSSYLVELIGGGEEQPSMPPEGEVLTADQIDAVKAWILAGAPMTSNEVDANARFRNHWSFTPLVRPEPPTTRNDANRHPIDQFIDRRLNDQQLSLNEEADRVTLIRRLYLVCLGMPPTPKDVARFQNDSSPDAYEQLVDRVLSDPRYGERWASHWLDIARFGETHGFETNRERPNAFPYRDYVIDSINVDQSYAQFVQHQIAGDELRQPIGTGFLVAGPYDLVKSPDINLTLMQRQDELADIVNTTGTAFLGMTIGCARCHHHKFDPITQRDFFSFQAVFAGVNHGESTVVNHAAQSSIDAIANELRQTQRRLSSIVAIPAEGWIFIPPAEPSEPIDRGLEYLMPIHGEADRPSAPDVQPYGSTSPQRFDRAPGSHYVWWNNRAGEFVGRYRLHAHGRFNVWLSWGSGYATHSQDAIYRLDADGDPSTTDDQQIIATIDQQRRAHEQSDDASTDDTVPPDSRQWSGFYFAGEFDISPGAVLLVQSGNTGEAITADWIALQSLDSDDVLTIDQDPVEILSIRSTVNVEFIKPQMARRLRFRIDDCNTLGETCIDELEVWSQGINVALASNNARIQVSGTLPGYDIHQAEHINDGLYGNDHSWIADTRHDAWVEIEFENSTEIDSIVWGRDRTGRYADRTATAYTIEVSNSASGDEPNWIPVASSDKRLAIDSIPHEQVEFTLPEDGDPRRSSAVDDLARLETLTARYRAVGQGRTVYAGVFGPPAETRRLFRGDPLAPREIVSPDSIEFFGALDLPTDAGDGPRRLALAEWIASPANPLTARVMANRLWQHTFGVGLVDTPSDFGLNGVAPTHPRLLDWLASELIDPSYDSATEQVEHAPSPPAFAWSRKQLHRQILLSRTFRQSSRPHRDGLIRDAQSRLLWRYPPHRLSSEAIRDSILLVCGNLNRSMGGPGFDGFEIQMENVRHYFPKEEFGPADWRRMIYMTKVRQEQESVFGAFDCPDGSQVQPVRSRSTTPRQALNLFNSPFMLSQAEWLAARLSEQEDSLESQIAFCYQLALSRPPDSAELQSATDFVRQHGLRSFCRVMLNSNEFLFVP